MVSPCEPLLRRPIRLTAILAAGLTLFVWACCLFIEDERVDVSNVRRMALAAPVICIGVAWFVIGIALAARIRWLWWWVISELVILWTGLAVLFVGYRQITAEAGLESLGDLAWFFVLLRIHVW